MHKDADPTGRTQGRPAGACLESGNRVDGGAVIRFYRPAAEVLV